MLRKCNVQSKREAVAAVLDGGKLRTIAKQFSVPLNTLRRLLHLIQVEPISPTDTPTVDEYKATPTQATATSTDVDPANVLIDRSEVSGTPSFSPTLPPEIPLPPTQSAQEFLADV